MGDQNGENSIDLGSDKKPPSTSTQLVELALKRYEFGCT